MKNKNRRVVISFSMPAWMAERFKAEANEYYGSVSDFIRILYIQHIKSYEAITGGKQDGK